MRIFVRRKSGPASKAIVVIALFLVIAIWIWAGIRAPAAEGTAIHARCSHLALLIGVQSSASPARRRASYVCLPDYFREGLKYTVVSYGEAPAQVVTTRTWKPLLFVAVLVLMGGFVWYARRSSNNSQP